MSILKIEFTPAGTVPPLGYRVKYRVAGSAGAYTTVTPNPVLNLAINGTDYFFEITGLVAGVSYEGTMEGQCGPGIFSGLAPFTGAVSCLTGQPYQGGKIAYVFKPGDTGYVAGQCHGIVAAYSDQGRVQWGCAGTNLTGAQGTAIGTGLQNTLDILAGCSTPGIAARLCAEYTITENGVVFDDWFLPSIEELKMLCAAKTVIGNFNTVFNFSLLPFYWCSTEPDTFTGNGMGSNVVQILNFSDGCIPDAGINKYSTALVRPIRYF